MKFTTKKFFPNEVILYLKRDVTWFNIPFCIFGLLHFSDHY